MPFDKSWESEKFRKPEIGQKTKKFSLNPKFLTKSKPISKIIPKTNLDLNLEKQKEGQRSVQNWLFGLMV